MSDSFEDLLDDTVKQHPIGAFQTFAEVEEGDSYIEQFAELLNAISTNVVVPVENKDELDEFADLAGQRVFGQIEDEDGIIFSDSGVSGVKNITRKEIDEISSELEDVESSGRVGNLAGFTAFPSEADQNLREQIYEEEVEVLLENRELERVLVNETVRNELVRSKNAIETIAGNEEYMSIFSNPKAIEAIENNWYVISGQSPPPAVMYLVEIEGGGGGHPAGAHGGDSYFGSAIAYGGDGGTASNSDGGYDAPDSPSQLIEGVVGGGGDGGEGSSTTDGYDGGYLKALISNENLDVPDVQVGKGNDEGEDGSVTIWVPPWA